MLNKTFKQKLLVRLDELCGLFVTPIQRPYQYKEIHDKNEAKIEEQIDECLEYLRVCIKYAQFDREACQRELRKPNG